MNSEECTKRRIGMNFPPVKDRDDVLKAQKGAVTQEQIRDGMQDDTPPVVRSVLELAHLMMSGHSQKLRAAPGYQGGLFYSGSPFCFASGYRDGTRPRDMDEKGNHMKLKDPLTYGVLSLPITAAYLCELHGTGVFDLHQPLRHYLPELEQKLDAEVTARSILSFRTVLNEQQIMKDAGVDRVRPHVTRNICAATQRYVYMPINCFFAGGSSAALSGQEQRENFVQYLRSSPSCTFKKVTTHRAYRCGVSHFSVALLVAAVERQLGGISFEASIRKVVFEPAQSHGAGYGPPKLWRDPNEIFYQPSGLALQHQGFVKPLAAGSLDNCGPPLLNSSLNLHAPVEDYGKLLLLSLDAIRHARKELGEFDSNSGAIPSYPHYDFGVEWLDTGRRLQLTRRVLGIDYIPTASSFRYNCEHDLGCFGICNCGTRDACLLGNTISRVIQHLFVKHIIEKGVNPMKGPNLDNPNEGESETELKFRKVVDEQKYTSVFKKHDAHTRF
ncbi:Beta-lactamase [Trypanosoma brucei equiperdum]|uniref:Beta-lactamase n=1 Tax=Trypanosoma brucei equiperdum TaxID=630700 RepID=A0A3L6KVD9_9TRYP|nr:Beta-lactamase [Trypanosoma brucei equiperdum]